MLTQANLEISVGGGGGGSKFLRGVLGVVEAAPGSSILQCSSLRTTMLIRKTTMMTHKSVTRRMFTPSSQVFLYTLSVCTVFSPTTDSSKAALVDRMMFPHNCFNSREDVTEQDLQCDEKASRIISPL